MPTLSSLPLLLDDLSSYCSRHTRRRGEEYSRERGGTVQEQTVTETIRRLLGQGLTSGEVIGQGYRPGTVYKVQRSMRLALGASPANAPVSEPSDSDWFDDPPSAKDKEIHAEEDAPVDRMAELAVELKRVESEIRSSLRYMDSEIGDGERRTSALKAQIREDGAKIAALTRTVTYLQDSVVDLITLLARQTMVPAQPFPWYDREGRALERTRRRLVEMDPESAFALSGSVHRGQPPIPNGLGPTTLGSTRITNRS